MALGAKADRRGADRAVFNRGDRGEPRRGGWVLSVMLDKVAAKWVTESSQDPLILAGVTVLLLMVRVWRVWLLRAARRRCDPMEALRCE